MQGYTVSGFYFLLIYIMKQVSLLALVLVTVGAINWGLVGLFGIDLVQKLFGMTIFAKIIYILVGVAGVYHVAMHCGCIGGNCKK